MREVAADKARLGLEPISEPSHHVLYKSGFPEQSSSRNRPANPLLVTQLSTKGDKIPFGGLRACLAGVLPSETCLVNSLLMTRML